MKKKIVKNKQERIVACLYIDKEGNLHPDSWLCKNGVVGQEGCFSHKEGEM